MMLSCWNEVPRKRPSFVQLRTTIDSLLLAGRKGDYIEFSLDSNRMSALFESTSEQTSSTPGLMDASPTLKQHSHSFAENEECKLLLPNDLTFDDCQKGAASSGGSPRFSPRRWSSRNPSPRRSRHCSPIGRLSPGCQSPKKKELSSEGLSDALPRPTSFSLFPGRRSSGSSSPQAHSPFHTGVSPDERAASQERRHRPASLFLTSSRGEPQSKPEDRYVKEPTKLSNLNHGANHSLTHLTISGGQQQPQQQQQQLQLRRNSEGTLNMNSDGYVSFVGVDYTVDRRAAVPPPQAVADIQITVTEDL